MGIITRMRKQTCVYWALASEGSAGEDHDDYGQPQYAAPIELTVRWSDKSVEFVDARGTKQMSKAKVYVGQDVDMGGALMLGELADITEAVNVLENDGAWEIRGLGSVPNLKATEFLRTAFL